MADPRVVLGVITASTGTSPGPSSGITYTIAVSDPATAGVFSMEGQKPLYRWPDELDIVALAPGLPVIGVMLGGEVTWHFMEQPAFSDCPSGLTEQQRLSLLLASDPTIRNVATGPNTGSGDIGNPDAGLPPEVPF